MCGLRPTRSGTAGCCRMIWLLKTVQTRGNGGMRRIVESMGERYCEKCVRKSIGLVAVVGVT